jgi:hypothetical protein
VMVLVLSRTIDGAFHFVASFATYEDALSYLRRAAEECRANNHRRVELDEDEGVLVTEYGGDDTVMTFIVHEDEVAEWSPHLFL